MLRLLEINIWKKLLTIINMYEYIYMQKNIILVYNFIEKY